ncbi:MAG TPA: galactokinase family protein, partial [Candidatus Limnocylindria bacterium]|nr:galactokinase family protein [Candidatus Limnocylindria bacterium]
MTDAASLPPELAARVPAGASVLSQAPGRANLIGEHTDYNEGFVLPVALGLRTAVVGRHGGGRIRLRSADAPGTVEIDPRTGVGPAAGWGRYVTAVAAVLVAAGHRLRPLEGLLVSTVPVGTGLSSSAALEVAVALALLQEPTEALTLARLCQRAENEGVGVRSGIMDQLVSAAAEP